MRGTALSGIERELGAHFNSLKHEKERIGAPVFALEHPFDERQTRNLSTLLEEHLRRHGVLTDEFWMCTVVCAAEHGYDFGGLEFWDSFAPTSTWWRYQNNRDLLREWFKRFATKYRGVKPSGSWAKRFRFISWPITHALLPRDLQLQLAETLHYARGGLAAAAELPDEELGRLIRAYAHFPTPRYKHFLQNEALVGQIVHTLLRDHGDQPAAIYLPTLRRISRDIAARGREREWIRAARERYAEPVARLGGRLARVWPGPGEADRGNEDRADSPVVVTAKPQRLLRTTFELRRPVSGPVQVFLMPPSFAGLCAERPEFRQALAERDIICTLTDRAKPATSLLSDRPSGWQMASWPTTDVAPVAFYPGLPEVLGACVGAMLPATGPVLLFEAFVGGRATQCSNLVVRPGRQYFLAAQTSGSLAAFGAPLAVDCSGIAVVELSLPMIVPNDLISALRSVGVSIRRCLTVRAAGLFPRSSLSGGYGEWLTTETVAFVLERDHEVGGIEVTLNGQITGMPVSTAHTNSLITLGRLPEGRHHLVIHATQHGSSDLHLAAQRASVEIEFVVRPPTVWVPNRLADDGMIALVDPPSPTIDDLLTGKLSLQAHGAAGHVKVIATLLKDDGHEILQREVLSRPLPLEASVWAQCMSDFLQGRDEAEFALVRSGLLSIQTRDMGTQTIRLCADPKPIRWVAGRGRQFGVARLINDGVQFEDIVVGYYGFSLPDRRWRIDTSSAIEGISVTDNAGLLVAQGGGCEQSIVTSPSRLVGGLEALLPPPIDPELSFHELVACCGQWARARPINATARLRQSRVVCAFKASLLEILCGKRWMRLEDSIDKNTDRHTWMTLEGGVEPGRANSYGISLSLAWCKGQVAVAGIREWHAKTTRAFFGTNASEECIRACWKVAAKAEDLSGYDCELLVSMDPAIRGILVRGARLLGLYAVFRCDMESR